MYGFRAVPRNEPFFGVVFGSAAGPIAVAVLLWRNSLVFHDYERMTSLYVHLVPNLIIYL